MRCFDPAAGPFSAELAQNDHRDRFTVHRADHDRLLRVPLERLAAEAGDRYGPSRVMRPNRDVGFGTDESPYGRDGSLSAGEAAGVHLQVGTGGIGAAGGLYEPSRDSLQRGTQATAERPGAARRSRPALDSPVAAGHVMADPSPRTAPRGHPVDHLEITSLRLKHRSEVVHLPLDADHDRTADAWAAIETLIA